jgi:uncharacterized protein (DUF2384 family)
MGRNQKLVGRAAKTPTYSKPLKSVGSVELARMINRKKAAGSGAITRESVDAHALATFGSTEKARHWMNRPNPLFHGKTPAEVLEIDLVLIEAELVRIDHGVYM